ncbi:MAG: ATP-grasp domain-containing protein [Fibrobacteraceae bacterium]|nr:ATP-grasp domain-containing protein [Fibrobacteraceae bacterium]
MIKIAIIGAGAMAKIFATRAKELNIETLCFAWEQGAIAKDSVDHFFNISIFEKDKITEICKKEQISGVLATTELTISIASYISNKLNLNGNLLQVAENITNKNWVREKAKSISIIKHPEHQWIYPDTNFADIHLKQYPVIVKPASGGGKKGITVVNSAKELEQALTYAKTSVKNDDGILIERFLDQGTEYSVESLSFEKKHFIIQITQKDSSGSPHCVELGHHQPANINSTIWQKVVAGIEELLTTLGIENGPCHTEIKIIDSKIYLIELNARPGGDHIAYPLTELSTGYKYITGIILASCGIFYDPKIYLGKKMCAGVYFVSKQTSHLQKTFDHCEQEPWCYKKNKVSEELQEITHNDGNNINYFIYCADKKPPL